MFAEVSHGWDLNRKRRPLYHWPCHSALYSRRQLWHLPCHFEDRVSVVGSGFRKSEFFNISGHRSWKFDQFNFALVDLFVEDHVTALCKGVPVKYFRLNICDLFSVFSSSKLVCSSSIGNNHWHATEQVSITWAKKSSQHSSKSYHTASLYLDHRKVSTRNRCND